MGSISEKSSMAMPILVKFTFDMKNYLLFWCIDIIFVDYMYMSE